MSAATDNDLAIAKAESNYWRQQAMEARAALRNLQAAHELLEHRDWFAVGDGRTPSVAADSDGHFTLYYCDRRGTTPCVTLGPRDVLLVGRYDGAPEREVAAHVLAGEPEGAP